MLHYIFLLSTFFKPVTKDSMTPAMGSSTRRALAWNNHNVWYVVEERNQTQPSEKFDNFLSPVSIIYNVVSKSMACVFPPESMFVAQLPSAAMSVKLFVG